MYCPNCGGQLGEGDQFCGSCGASAGAQGQAPTQPAQPTEPMQPSVQPTEQMPPQGTGAWQQAPPQQPGMQPPGTMPPQPGFGYGAAPPPPPSGANTALIIAGVAIAAIVLIGGGIGAFLMLRGNDDPPPDEPPITTTQDTTSTDTTASSGSDATAQYATAEEALAAELPSDWVYDIVTNTAQQKEYWAGPPASEYTDVYLLEPTADGGWEVVDTYALEYGDVPGGDAETVQYLVEDFLLAIYEDRPDDAHMLTVGPFADDPASASYSNGDFINWEVVAVRDVGDGTFWVDVTEEWVYGTDPWTYHVVPTEAGWRINELMPR